MAEAIILTMLFFGVVFFLILLFSMIKILREYERGVVFRLGRIIPVKGPGLVIIWPIIDKLVNVSLRTVTMDVPAQDVITRDNISVKVNAVVYFRVMDPMLRQAFGSTFDEYKKRSWALVPYV